MIPNNISKYLHTRAVQDSWHISGCANGGFAGAIVIPALAESANLFATLSSISRNPEEILSRFLVLVVVNQREDTPYTDKIDNQDTLAQLAASTVALPNLAWVDGTATGCELPAKAGGVGLARKIGLDLALGRLEYIANDPILISLDADTLVQPDYLPAIERHFQVTQAGGAIIPFRHQPGISTAEQMAIDHYELFLRCYVLGLAAAGSPYAFHTVGSAMACRASAYVRMGGMNTRQAGEDFYFLQQLHKTASIAQVRNTLIFPSARASHRVPFGTGRSVARLLACEPEAVLFYRTECFQILRNWLLLAESSVDVPSTAVLDIAATISDSLVEYLYTLGFTETWQKLQQHNRKPEAFRTAFHCWFDGLKTMKLIHHLSSSILPRCKPAEAVPSLFALANLMPADDLPGQLLTLQLLQNNNGIS